MPPENRKKIVFNKFISRANAPVVICFDFKIIPAPLTASIRIVIEKQEPCCFCFVIMVHGSSEPVYVAIDVSETGIEKLALHLQSVPEGIY